MNWRELSGNMKHDVMFEEQARAWLQHNLLSPRFELRLVEEFQQRHEHGQTQSTDQNVEDSCHVAQCQCVLRRSLHKNKSQAVCTVLEKPEIEGFYSSVRFARALALVVPPLLVQLLQNSVLHQLQHGQVEAVATRKYI